MEALVSNSASVCLRDFVSSFPPRNRYPYTPNSPRPFFFPTVLPSFRTPAPKFPATWSPTLRGRRRRDDGCGTDRARGRKATSSSSEEEESLEEEGRCLAELWCPRGCLAGCLAELWCPRGCLAGCLVLVSPFVSRSLAQPPSQPLSGPPPP